jgi:hypothetical protein
MKEIQILDFEDHPVPNIWLNVPQAAFEAHSESKEHNDTVIRHFSPQTYDWLHTCSYRIIIFLRNQHHCWGTCQGGKPVHWSSSQRNYGQVPITSSSPGMTKFNRCPHKSHFRGLKIWSSESPKSGLCAGCCNTSHPLHWNLRLVCRPMCGDILLWSTLTR